MGRSTATRAAAALLGVALQLTALSIGAGQAWAGDPSQRWYTVTTPHFQVHAYHNIRHDLRPMARRVARIAERVHDVLSPLLRHTPAWRTQIVLSDDSDGANGSAQVVPYNLMRIFATGPAAGSSLADYDDWLYVLLMHEYTHILHIDTVHGLPRVINAIFGKSWAPNQLQPPWFVEGWATYQESERTSGGRVRGSLFDMLLRAALLEGKWLDIDQISSSTRYYPRGIVRYLYGSKFVKYIADRYGDARLAALSHDYGGTLIPYGINRAARRAFGRTFVELYRDFREHLTRRYRLQIALARERGLTVSEPVTTHGESVSDPRYSASGKELLYTANDGHHKEMHLLLDAASGRVKQRYRSIGGGATLTPDGRSLVDARSQSWRTFYSYTDIYVRDRATLQTRRLTQGLRAHDPDVSPDGRLVAFVTNDLGTNDLAEIPLAGGKHRVLLRGVEGQQVSTPRYSPDGRRLVFSRWIKGGYRDIYLLERATRRLTRLTADRAQDLDPVFSPDGQRVYFASDRSEIFNIYCYDLKSRRLTQVTNVVGGAFMPAIGPHERTMYFVTFSARGYDLQRMRLDRDRFLPALPYVDARPAAAELPPAHESYPITSYTPWRTIYPRAWFFSLGTDAFGSTLGIEVEGSDAIGRHAYRLAANVSAEKGYPSYAASYNYSRLWPSVQLTTSRFEGPRGGLSVDGARRTYIEQNYGAGLGLGLPVLRIPEHSVTLTVGYRFNWFRDGEGDTDVLVGPDEISPQLPATGRLSGVALGASYGNSERYTYSVSNERGRQLSLNLRVNDVALGSDFDSVQLSWAWAEYLDIPWFDDHALALRLAGGVGRGDSSRRGLFSIGGFPEQNLIDAVVDLAPLGGAYLRGYPPGAFFGNQYHLLNVEYRFPLFDIERGLSSLPLYFNHVHMALFADVGDAVLDELDLSELKVGVGAELLVEWVIFYAQPFTFRFGYARGLMEKGGNELHVLIGNRF